MTLVGGLHVEMDFLLNRCILIILKIAPHQNDGKVASACLLKNLIAHDTLKLSFSCTNRFCKKKYIQNSQSYSLIKNLELPVDHHFTYDKESKIY